MDASRSRTSAPAIVSGGGKGPSGSAAAESSRTRSRKKRLGELPLDLVGRDVEVLAPDPDEPDIEDKVGVGTAAKLLHQGRLAGKRPRIDLQALEARPPHPPLLHRHVARPVALVELHEQDAAGTILVDGHRLGRAAVRPRRHAGLATLRGVPVTEREVVEVRGGDLAGREHDLVRVGLARDRERPMDHPDVPPCAPVGGGGEVRQGAARRSLGREDEPVDDEVQDAVDHVRPVGREDHQPVGFGRQAGHRGQVVGPVHGRSIVEVVGAGDDHHPDRGIRQPLELGRRALHGAPRLRVRVEEVADDQQRVDLLLEGEVDGGTERHELALALGGGLVAQVGVAGTQVDVGRMEQAQHPRHCAAFGETCPAVRARHGPNPDPGGPGGR